MLSKFFLILTITSCAIKNDRNTIDSGLTKDSTIRIFLENSKGLKQDYDILRSSLEHQFHVISQDEEPERKADVNIFMEVVHQEFLEKASRNMLLVNQEQIGPSATYKNIDMLLCKTQLCMKVIKQFKIDNSLKAEVRFLGFTSKIAFNSHIKKDYNLFVHLAGKSPYKNTGLVLDTWRKHPDLPHIVVTCIDVKEENDCFHRHLVGENSPKKLKNHSNITLHTHYLPLEEANKLMDSAGFFVTPSQVEGFGHYLNEGRGRGAINITIDAPPMNEMINRNSGFLTPSILLNDTMGQAKSPLFSFNSEDLYTQVINAVNSDISMKKFLSERSLQKFQVETEIFEKNLKELFNPLNIPQKVEQILPEDYGPVELPKRHYKAGVVMTVWERPDVLKTSIQSLENSSLGDNVIFIVVDDKSKTEETYNIINQFKLSKATLVKIKLLKNSGLLKSMLTGMNLIRDKVDYIMNLDPDMYLKKDWLNTLLTTHEEIKKIRGNENFLVTGFNTQSHETIGCANLHDYHEIQTKCCTVVNSSLFFCPKKDVGGVNFVYSSKFFKDHVHNILETIAKGNWKLWDWDLVHDFTKNNFGIYATSPSVLQHLGTRGTNARPDQHVDFAEDF